MKSAAFSASIITGALRFPLVMLGMMEASTTRPGRLCRGGIETSRAQKKKYRRPANTASLRSVEGELENIPALVVEGDVEAFFFLLFVHAQSHDGV